MKNFSPVSNHTLARGLVAYPKKPFAAMTDLPKRLVLSAQKGVNNG
jgi:hypothetical protein